MKDVHRWAIREYDKPTPIIREMASISGLSDIRIRELLNAAGERIAKSLRMQANPIKTEIAGIKAVDIAGIVRVAPGIELEIIPKFLGASSVISGWREDFFFLANLSRYGRLLLSERLGGSRASCRDIPSLVGYSIVEEYLLHRRRPLRSYRRHTRLDFSIDGEVDPESVAQPDPEGFLQETISFDRRNVFNATISAASNEIARECRNPALQAQLRRIAQSLGEQERNLDLKERPVPRRARQWQSLFDLSRDIVRGFGLAFDHTPASMPGFVVGTWQIWEDVISMALRLGLGTCVEIQRSAILGRRIRLEPPSIAKASVTPDATLSTISLLIDAKYKSRHDRGTQRISEADLYEALAFTRATGIRSVALIYPALSIDAALGTLVLFETIELNDIVVRGYEVSVVGISKRGMLRSFSSTLAHGIKNN